MPNEQPNNKMITEYTPVPKTPLWVACVGFSKGIKDFLGTIEQIGLRQVHENTINRFESPISSFH